jgi:hypothetical protein
MDGAGRVVAWRPALVLGVDTIAALWTTASLPVFLSHELFHRHNFQAAGFSDDLSERDDSVTHPLDENLIPSEPELLRQTNGLAFAVLEELGGLHSSMCLDDPWPMPARYRCRRAWW